MNGKSNIEAFQDLLDSKAGGDSLLAAIVKLTEVKDTGQFLPSAKGGPVGREGGAQPLGSWGGWGK